MDIKKIILILLILAISISMFGCKATEGFKKLFSKDGEEIEFFWCSDKPNTCALGNAFYKNKNGTSNLINISELDII